MKRPLLPRVSIGRHFRRSVWINPAALMVYSLIAVVTVYTLNVHIIELIELKTYDLRFLSRGPENPSPAVAMVVIDEKSLEVEGRWPWPRSKIAAQIDAISRDGAKVIGFDIIFSEPDENSQLAVIDEFTGRSDELAIGDPRLRRFVTERRRAADNDATLAVAIKRSRAAVVLGYFFHDESTLDYQKIVPVPAGQTLTCSQAVTNVVSSQNGGIGKVVCTAQVPDLHTFDQFCSSGQVPIDFVPISFLSDVTYSDDAGTIESAKHSCTLPSRETCSGRGRRIGPSAAHTTARGRCCRSRHRTPHGSAAPVDVRKSPAPSLLLAIGSLRSPGHERT
ncbi:MAG TPA: CHASE2 domain-containing protein [Methylomirabilota bacterium]|nr:CHASE2 domain-containing protein [Methylomirabilota bacterium]